MVANAAWSVTAVLEWTGVGGAGGFSVVVAAVIIRCFWRGSGRGNGT